MKARYWIDRLVYYVVGVLELALYALLWLGFAVLVLIMLDDLI